MIHNHWFSPLETWQQRHRAAAGNPGCLRTAITAPDSGSRLVHSKTFDQSASIVRCWRRVCWMLIPPRPFGDASGVELRLALRIRAVDNDDSLPARDPCLLARRSSGWCAIHGHVSRR